MLTNANMPSHNSLNVYFGRSNGELLRYYNCRQTDQALAYDMETKQCKACSENCLACQNSTHCSECDTNNRYGVRSDGQCVYCDESLD